LYTTGPYQEVVMNSAPENVFDIVKKFFH